MKILHYKTMGEGLAVVSFFPSFFFPMGCAILIRRKGAPFEVMTGRTAPSSDGVLAEVFLGFP